MSFKILFSKGNLKINSFGIWGIKSLTIFFYQVIYSTVVPFIITSKKKGNILFWDLQGFPGVKIFTAYFAQADNTSNVRIGFSQCGEMDSRSVVLLRWSRIT
jgi:hypothetical protein